MCLACITATLSCADNVVPRSKLPVLGAEWKSTTESEAAIHRLSQRVTFSPNPSAEPTTCPTCGQSTTAATPDTETE